MTVRLYVDEDALDNNLVSALRVRGVDIITAREAGLIEQKDEVHLEYATGQGRTLFSFNVGDFYRLHASFLRDGKSHAGIILARQQRYSVGEQMRRLLKLTATKSAEEMRHQVEYLSAWD